MRGTIVGHALRCEVAQGQQVGESLSPSHWIPRQTFERRGRSTAGGGAGFSGPGVD